MCNTPRVSWNLFIMIVWLTLGACARVTVLALSHSVHRATENSDHFYASTKARQTKHDQSLQFDSWILRKCFHSRVTTGSPWPPSRTSLRTKTLMVGCLGTLTVDLNCSTALGCINTSRKGCQLTAHVYVFGCSHAHLTHLDRPTY